MILLAATAKGLIARPCVCCMLQGQKSQMCIMLNTAIKQQEKLIASLITAGSPAGCQLGRADCSALGGYVKHGEGHWKPGYTKQEGGYSSVEACECLHRPARLRSFYASQGKPRQGRRLLHVHGDASEQCMAAL